MTPAAVLWLALVAVEVAAVVLAGWRAIVAEARRPRGEGAAKPCRSPVGFQLLWLLAFALADELAVEALHVLVFEGAPRPFAGWVRVAYHVETAIVTAWPALLAATCWRAVGVGAGRANRQPDHGFVNWTPRSSTTERRPLDVFLASWLGLVVALAALYPLDAPGSGAPRTRAVLHTWEVLCVVAAWWGVWRGRARRWGRVEEALVIVAACETMVALVGPWASDPFTRWWIGRCFYLAAWSALVGVLARAARRV